MEGFQFQFVDAAFLVAFLLVGYKIHITIKKLNRTTYQDPGLKPLQRSESEDTPPEEP